MPYGKYHGMTIEEVFETEPGYLAWFHETVEGQYELKQAIRELSGMADVLARYWQRHPQAQVKRPVEDTAAELLGEVEEPLDEDGLDQLCDQLFNGYEEE
jgi:hypothetical protein